MPKVLIFTGAPEPDWSSAGFILAPGPTPAFPSTSPPSPPSIPSPLPSAPSWRSLPLHRQPLKTGFSQPHGLPSDFPAPAHFFSLSLSFASKQQDITAITASQPLSQDQLLSQFYDHSLALHHDLASSQLPPPPTPSRSGGTPTQGEHADSFDTTAEAGDSFVTETTDSFLDATTTTTIIATPSARPALVTSHRLTDLRDVPPAPDLLRLAPQTLTVNLIAGVISVSEPRPVTTRWGNELSLVEVLVGDDTSAGFGVTFWLPPNGGSGSGNGNGNGNAGGSDPSTPARLRRQDVVLLQNVALHAFRDKVYGQSLRKGLTRTTVLYRRKLAEDDEGGYYRRRDLDAVDDAAAGDGGEEETHPQLVKTKKVWEWVLRFVGGEERPNAKGKKKKRGWDAPPDDTQ
ncbi:hypothetical protein CTA2_3457 [Colletotrichum tanaceti]|uniref:Nucleic acid-binding, OB-fold protein n=1 Tax=Colletotrichum tanaceti TaxID=1306861 RepID=A0A4U6XMC2_9PEZI|nr:hypothetical protein CTA2_3457 [Colletotrichum tanaceti]TKW56794.1 hypothetical protein CTA1_6844 [Colletotrichum tanaceti]